MPQMPENPFRFRLSLVSKVGAKRCNKVSKVVSSTKSLVERGDRQREEVENKRVISSNIL
jgi:hypothetical protein